MRIIHVMPGIGMGGGAEQSFAVSADGLIARGHELHLALLTDRRALVPKLEELGVIVHDLSGHRSMVGRARAIRRLVQTVRPDLVHATLYAASTPTQLGLRGLGVPVLVTWTAMTYGRERMAEQSISTWRLHGYRAIEGALAKWCPSDYQAVTMGVGASYGAAIGAPADRVHVAERGRPDVPPRDPERRARTRASLGLDPEAVMVLCTARHDPRKGLIRIVGCFDDVVDAVPDAHLVVAGAEGPATDELRSAMASSPHPGHVHLLGFRSDVADLLEAADVFALTSHSEGAAGAAIEAMAHVLPIVSARLDGLDGVLVDGVNARIVDGGAPRSFVAPVVELASDPALADRLGAAGRSTFEERFTLERSVDALDDLYRLLVAKAAGGRGA